MVSDDHAPGFVPGRGYTQEDWDEVCDNPEITPEQAAVSRPLAEAMPDLVAAMKRGRGDPRGGQGPRVAAARQGRAGDAARQRLGLAEPGERDAATGLGLDGPAAE